jgi:hypothetical protein
MSKENGFLAHRRGIWQHVRDGRMSLQDVAVHQYIASQADTRTGVWHGSAGALAGELSISPRMARRHLEKLSRRGYIRRFPVSGKHVCYPILVHKITITNGEHKGEQLDAINSLSPMDLRYCRTGNAEQGGEHWGEDVPSQNILETREKRKRQKPAATPPADFRRTPFIDVAYKSYERKHGRKPLWQGKDWTGLAAFLKGHSTESLPLERLMVLWENYSASTDPFIAKQGDSLAYFCSNINQFQNGPILAIEGRRHGKLDTNEAVAITMRAWAEKHSRPN